MRDALSGIGSAPVDREIRRETTAAGVVPDRNLGVVGSLGVFAGVRLFVSGTSAAEGIAWIVSDKLFDLRLAFRSVDGTASSCVVEGKRLRADRERWIVELILR